MKSKTDFWRTFFKTFCEIGERDPKNYRESEFLVSMEAKKVEFLVKSGAKIQILKLDIWIGKCRNFRRKVKEETEWIFFTASEIWRLDQKFFIGSISQKIVPIC